MWLSCGIFIHETAVGPQTHRASTHQAPGSSQELLWVTAWSSLRRRLSLQEIGEIGVELAKFPPSAGVERQALGLVNGELLYLDAGHQRILPCEEHGRSRASKP